MAQRTMNTADGDQILVGEATYQTLCEREKYLDLFHPYTTTTKHGDSFKVYQFISKDYKGLNTDVPLSFKPKQQGDPKLTRLVAFYMAHAIKNRLFLEQQFRSGNLLSPATVLLYLLAIDSEQKISSGKFVTIPSKTYNAGIATIQEQYDFYCNADGWLILEFSNIIDGKHLSIYNKYFEGYSWSTYYTIVNEEGKDKLKKEYPDIWQEFGLDNVS
jgi:hypothetical protein